MKINVAYLQSGGPTAVINASLYGVIKQCKIEKSINTLFIIHNGIKGLINNDLKDTKDIAKDQIELLPYTPGAICGSVRYKLSENTEDEDYQKILENLKLNNIHILIFNGGNDSMDTANKVSQFLDNVGYDCKVIGIPKTIDNDLLVTDHTPGFASAAKYIANAVQTISYDNDCYPKGRVNIVEIMGRDTGWLAASAGIATINGFGPDLIYVPEVPFSLSKFLKDVSKVYEEKKRCLVVVSEGIKDKQGNFLSLNKAKDAFNHAQLGGVGQYLASVIEEQLAYSTRTIDLSLLQRCYAPSISRIDQQEAIKCGKNAVKFAVDGLTDVMVTMIRNDNLDYSITYSTSPLGVVANGVKYLPEQYLNKQKNNISHYFIDYCFPLLANSIDPIVVNGLYCYADKRKF